MHGQASASAGTRHSIDSKPELRQTSSTPSQLMPRVRWMYHPDTPNRLHNAGEKLRKTSLGQRV